METPLFQDRQRVSARALFIGQRLETRALEQARRLATLPLTVDVGAAGCAVLFRYGAVVFFGASPAEQTAFLADLASLVVEPFDRPESEEIDIVCDAEQPEHVEQNEIVLHKFSIERLQLVADVLAKSAVLSHYEGTVGQSFDRIEPLAAALERGGKGSNQARELLRHIGDTLSTHGKMVGRVEIQEKPELLWEHPELERLYLRLEDEYELQERHRALEGKLELIGRTAETLLGLLHHRRSLRVEWYIVILIVVEVLLTLYQMFFAHAG